jgi:hypothetical protein
MLNNELLNNKLKKNPFSVPDKYFDSLPSKVQDRCVMSKENPVHGFIPKLALAWSGGIIVLVLALFLSYLNFNNTSIKENPETFAVRRNDRNTDLKTGSDKNYLKSRRDAMVEYLAVRNVNLNDYLTSKY